MSKDEITSTSHKRGRPEQKEIRRERVKNVWYQLCKYKETHDGSTITRRKLASLSGIHLVGIQEALDTLAKMGLIERGEYGYGDIIIVGGKWIPPEEPDWEEIP